jgi:membrane protease YdiL (CAAX protease family)
MFDSNGTALPILIFIIASIVFTAAWGIVLWFFAEKSKLLTRFIFYLMSFTRKSFPEIRSIILSLVYFSAGILGVLVFAGIYHLDIPGMFTFQVRFIPLILLGITAEISLASFFIGVYIETLHDKRINPKTEIRDIPWIDGLCKLPPSLLAIFLVIGGLIEEFFFRGILLLILVKRMAVSPWAALGWVTILFLVEQLLQLRTKTQAAILGFGCIAISLVGGLLVLYTGSIIPAGLSHASFVIFFFGYSGILVEKKS